MYANKNMRGIAKQLLQNPPAVRQKHADRLEALLEDIDRDRRYALEFIYYRITGFRASDLPIETIDGETLYEDLQQMLEEISASSPTPVEEVPEKVLPISDVSRIYDVSERTIYRWREKGLVTRKYKFPHGRERMGVRAETLRQFADQHSDLVSNSSKFSPLSEEEQTRIRECYCKLKKETSESPTTLAETVSEKVGRATDTVRRVVQNSVQAGESGGATRDKLDLNQKKQIYHQYRKNVSVQELSAQYDRSRSSIYRIVNQQYARELIHVVSQLPQSEMDSDDPSETEQSDIFNFDNGATDETVFKLYHYLKGSARQQTQSMDPKRYVASRDLESLSSTLGVIHRIQHKTVEKAMPVIFETAQQHRGEQVGFADLVDEGCVWVLLAIERYNYKKKGEFQHFVRLELMKNFARTIPSDNYMAGVGSDSIAKMMENREFVEGLENAADRLRSIDLEPIADEEMNSVVQRFDLAPHSAQAVICNAAHQLGRDQKKVSGVLNDLNCNQRNN